MIFLEMNPAYRDLLQRAGLECADDFLACAGEPVNVRAGRQVHRVVIGGDVVAYLKTERIRPRDRWMSWWAGYGAVAKSVREGMVLEQVARAGIGCPPVLALGERSGMAFVLLKAETDLVPLDGYLRSHPDETGRVMGLVGNEIARVHAAGFCHPDLFAKHILVGRCDGLYRFCLLDWQRTHRAASVPWSRRVSDLAVLDAALPLELVTQRHRLRLLRSYLDVTPGERLGLDWLTAAVRSRARLMARRRRVQAHRRAGRGTVAVFPLRLADPTRPLVPLASYLRPRVDLHLRRRLLDQAGRRLRELHETGYGLRGASLDCVTVDTTNDGPDIQLTGVDQLQPTTAAAEQLAAPDLADLDARAAGLSRTDRLRFLRGYLGLDTPRQVRQSLIHRVLAVREVA